VSLRDQLQRTLGDAYTIERELGGGGMSRVFVATENALGREVVVKILPAEMAGQLSADRFKREIAVAARLQHPHIVPLLTAGDADGLPYFTMPLVKGESLRARLARQGELPVNEAVRTLREIAGALAFAHESGVVHRDIKPDNVLLSGGVAMVTDFGVAKALSASTTSGESSLTSLGVALGTPAYMSPEQASADPLVDHRADIYAWGVLAYELLTGSPPFAGRPAAAMLAAHVSEVVEPVSRRRLAIPPALSALVMKCLEKRPADRPQRAEELVHTLDALSTPSAGMPPTGAMGATSGRAIPAAGHGKLMVGAVAVALVLAFAYWRTQTAKPPAGEVHSIAVLPFENASGDTTFDYLAEGVSDEVRSQLTRLGLSVRARASSQAFRGKRIDLQEVATKLGVSEVVSGSVRQVGNRLHVTAELIRIADGNALWSLAIDAPDTSLAAVQDSITRATAGALRERRGDDRSGPAGVASARGTADFEAYNAFLKGEYHRRRYQLDKAIPLLREAVARDSGFARAYASLAAAYATLPALGFGSPDSARLLAAANVAHALALDSTVVRTHIAKSALFLLDLRFREAESAARRAVALDPGEPEAYVVLSWALGVLGKVDESLKAAERARDLDPLSTDALIGIHYAHYMAHRYRASVDAGQQTIALDPKGTNGLLIVALDYAFLGKRDSAAAYIDSSLAIDPKSFGSRGIAAFVYAASGRWDDAARQRPLAEQDGGNSPNFVTMQMDIVFGELDAAMAAAERGIRAREPLFSWLYVACDPMYDPLKTKPRFVALLKELGATPCAPEPRWPITLPPKRNP
jgi:serine/threonine-protein kinase